MANKFKKGDQVIVISGASKGKTGKILSFAKNDRVLVEGVNIATIHKKPDSSNPGSIAKIEKPIHVSNISHVENDKPIKIKFVIEQGQNKIFARKYRVSKKTQKRID